MAFIISLPARLDLLCGIDMIQQRLASTIEALRKDSAPGTLRRRSWAPGGGGFIVRAAAISSGDRGGNSVSRYESLK